MNAAEIALQPREERWPKAGDRMRYLAANGYDRERADADKVMKAGDVFTVKSCRVGDWSHSVQFEEIAGNWNGVMFELEPATSPSSNTGEPK